MKKAKLLARTDTQSVRVVLIWLESGGSYNDKCNLPPLAD